MIPGDRKGRWNPDRLSDNRVSHFWDGERELGRWISEHATDCAHLGPVDWDSFYVFREGVEWKREFPDPIACGTPILNATEELSSAIAELFDGDQPAAEESLR